MKKFELTEEFITNSSGTRLFKIRALISFGDVVAGDFGGYIESEDNISHSGDAWVYGNAQVYGNARVYENAQICNNAIISGNAWVYENALVYGDAIVYGNARIRGSAQVYGNAQVCSDAIVSGNARVRGNTQLYGDIWISGDAWVCSDADYVHIHGFGTKNRTTTFYRNKDGGISVRCGCFVGTLDDFREKVKRTYVHSKYAKEYLMMANLMQMHFEN